MGQRKTEEQKQHHRDSNKKWALKNPDKVAVFQARKRDKRREWYRNLKQGLSCIKCGESHPACLDFHHRDPDSKIFVVGRGLGWGEKRVLEEIAKCDVLCANCHRKLHHVDSMLAEGE